MQNLLHKLRIAATRSVGTVTQIKQQITVSAHTQKYLDSFVSKASCILQMVKPKIMSTAF